MLSGSNSKKNLTFERATDLAALHSFKCGQEEVDHIIREELPYTLTTNDLYLVKDGDEVVALFCLQKDTHCLFLSDLAKENMQKGSKPKSESAREEGEEFWERFNYDSNNYTAVPFYQKCHFYAAVKPVAGQNLMMYRIIPKAGE